MSVQIVKLLDPLNPTIVTGGLVPKGAYNGATDYAVGDSVDYNGSSYVMYVDAGAGTLPTDTTKWQVLANKGDTGAAGADGADSIVAGPAGTDGTDGADGADGKTVLNGAVDPTTEGVDGDFYINTTSDQIFGPKTAGAWGSGTSLVGPDGADGADGLMTSVVAGTGISVDSTDPANPIVTNTQTSAVWGAITGTLASQTDLVSAIPVNAAGTDLDTGTDTTKFATAAAILASHNVPSVVPSTSGNVLTSNGTDWTSATPTGGGQEAYTHIVAASGGDYTTLGAAITAASAGDSIYVRAGTYAETTITTALNNLTIVGESNQTSIVGISTTVSTFSGTGVTLRNLGITVSTGRVVLSGANATMVDCVMIASGTPAATAHISSTAADCTISGFNASHTAPGTSNTLPVISSTAVRFRLHNSYILVTQASSATTAGRAAVYCNGASAIVNENFFYSATGTYQRPAVRISQYSTVNNNVFSNLGGASILVDSGAGGVISDNVIEAPTTTVAGYGIYIDNTSFAVISGNFIRANSAPTYIGIHSTTNGSDNIISNNFIGVNTGNGINVAATNYQVTGNRIARGAAGTSIAVSAENALISNNHISGFSSSTSTAMTDTGKNTNIIGNHVQTNATGVVPISDRRVVTMKNTAAAGLAEGDIVVHKAVANGYEVTTTTTAGDNKVFGVVATAIANTANSGPILVEGKTVALKVDGTTDIAIGDFISTFTTAGIGQKAVAGHTAIAIALEAYTTNDSNGVIDALVIAPRLI